MKAYSIDLRQKIIDAYNKKEGSYRELAKRFSVARSFVQKLLTRYKDTGRVSALPHRGGQKSKLKCKQIEMLQQTVAENNDATLVELCKAFESKTQIKISKSTMERVLHKLKIVRKKKRSMLQSKIRKESKS